MERSSDGLGVFGGARALMALASGMSLERALVVNADLLAVQMHTMGLRPACPDLRGYSLAEMLVASHIVRDWNPPADEDGHRSIPVFCDDRLVAASYAWAQYHGEPAHRPEPIVHGDGRALVCVRVPSPKVACAQSEAEED